MKRGTNFLIFKLLLLVFCFNIQIILYISAFGHEYISDTHQITNKEVHFNNPQSSINYYNHSPIIIVGNEEIKEFSLSGNGTFSDPYIFNDLRITANDSTTSISITNTCAFIQISNCYFQNGTSGISLSNASNVKIINNTFNKNFEAISILNSSRIRIGANYIINNQIGINLIKRNYDIIIFENLIINNTIDGVTSFFSSSITISNNNIIGNEKYGLRLGSSNNFTLCHNNFSYNVLEGVFLNSTANVIVVIRNNFIQNNLNGISQTYDNGVHDFFIYNYWDEWIEPDINDDGIVDNPYTITGKFNNIDPFPQTRPNILYLSSEKKRNLTSDIPSIIIAFAVITTSSGIIGGGVLITKKGLKKRNSKINLFKNKKEDEWIKTPWITLVIAPIIWLFSQILYPPRVRKLSHSKVLNNPIRQKILKILEEREFEHYSSLMTQLDCGVSIFEWHLQVLEDFGLIRTTTFGQYKIFFLRYFQLDEYKLKIYFSIKSEKALIIISYLLKQKTDFNTIKTISKSLNMNFTTVNYHCNKLVSIGLFIKQQKTKNIIIADNKEEYIDWLINRLKKDFT